MLMRVALLAAGLAVSSLALAKETPIGEEKHKAT